MRTAIAGHLYQVGDRVSLDGRAGNFLRSDLAFTVVAQLPESGGEVQYRIKGAGELCERMVMEHQLTRATPQAIAASGAFKDRHARTI